MYAFLNFVNCDLAFDSSTKLIVEALKRMDYPVQGPIWHPTIQAATY